MLTTQGRAGFPSGIGCTDPRSQKRDLGHPSIVFNAASWIGGLRKTADLSATYALSKNISRNRPRNRRSLHSASLRSG
jgi:hypothetical protein